MVDIFWLFFVMFATWGFFLPILAKVEYFLKILIHQLKYLTKKSNTIDDLVQKTQLDEHGKFSYYVMLATMDMPICTKLKCM
jgi:hypothetical protein